MTRTLTAIAAALLAASTAGAFAATPAPHSANTATTKRERPKTEASLPSSHQGSMMSARRVEEIQVGLQQAGAKIAADGIWGSKTAAALKTFQKDHGLRPTGHYNRATAQKLNIPHWS